MRLRATRCMRSAGKQPGMLRIRFSGNPLNKLGFEIPVSLRRALYSVSLADAMRYAKFSRYTSFKAERMAVALMSL